MNFNDMGLEARFTTHEVKLNDNLTLTVRDYLPTEEKTAFIQYVVNSAIDERTGCFSPLRVEVYFSLALCHWYGGIDFDDLSDAGKTYDVLDTNGIIYKIGDSIDEDEYRYIRNLVKETVDDIARYNNSAAGIIQMMQTDTDGLSNQINNIMAQIRENGDKGQLTKMLDNMVGND